MNKRFLFILTISLISLVALIGGFFLFNKDNSLTFQQDGYILETTKTSSNRYYFNEGTKYKENLEDKYEFIDVDNVEVASSKDNFIHYLDNSIVFLKNGVILDIDNVNSSIVPYYNITNKSVITYNNNVYNIKSQDKTLVFNNFSGRISEDKYIIVGNDVNLKLSTSNEKRKVNYLEILYVENGVVNIENQEISYQVVAEGNYIYVGEHVIIDLGKKKVYYDNEEKLSLTQMTIDGNENIEIIPEVEQENKNNTTNDDSTSTNIASNNETNNAGLNNGGTTGGGTINNDNKAIPSINLLSASVNANKIEASVQVIDTDEVINNNLVLNITNTTTGKRIYSSILNIEDGIANINVETLSPDSNYLLSIGTQTNEGENQYFQKIFRTDTLGISLEKDYATTDSLNYIVSIDEQSNVSSVNLYLYDENYNSVISRDNGDGNIVDYYTITKGSNNNTSISLDNLTKNTSYTAVINNVVYNNVEYIDKYTISKTNKTLKESPTAGNLSFQVNEDKQLFTLSINDITDPDKSITKYTYLIYDTNDLTLGNTNIVPIKTIEKKDTITVDLNIDGTIIKQKHDYRYRVLVEYYDNEKYGEYLTELSEPFIVSGKPFITFTLDEENTSFNKIVGTIKLEDENCTVSLNGRTCNDQANNVILEYRIVNSTKTETIANLTFNPETLTYNMELNNLLANSDYEINVYANVNLKDGQGVREGYLLGTVRASTTEIDSLIVKNWKQNESTSIEPINVEAKLASLNGKDNLIKSVAKVTFNLYTGSLTTTEGETPIKSITSSGNIKSKYYDSTFNLKSSNLFGITLKDLKNLSGGRLNRYYTIEITDAIDSLEINEVPIENNLFVIEMPPILLIEAEIDDPTIEVLPVQNQSLGNNKNKDLNNDTIVKYKVTANVSMSGLLQYFSETNIKSINFYAYDKQGREVGKKILTLPSDDYYVYFDVANGTDYATNDYSNCSKINANDYSCLVRGNEYTFKFNVSIDTGTSIQYYPSNIVTSSKVTPLKQAPKFKMYIDGSTSNSITYKYQFVDIDKALYYDNGNYYFYYDVDGTSMNNKILTMDSDYETSKTNYNNFDIFKATKSVSFNGLENNSKYELFIKRALSKDSEVEKLSIGKYTFDGYYSAASYNLAYKLSYSVNDNRLRILILKDNTNSELLKRMAAYELVINDGNNSVTKVYPKLNTCKEDNVDYDCLIISYSEIIDFKGKDTTVKLYGYYDNGTYLGFGNKNSNLGLFQTNSTENGLGNYIKQAFNGAVYLSETPYNLYTYSIGAELQSKVNINDTTNLYASGTPIEFQLTYTENGIMGKKASFSDIFNPKEVSKSELVTESNYFRFDSITPKISVDSKSTINGAILSITSPDINSTILEEEFIKEDNEYYFYIDIYKNKNDSDVYRQIKVKYSELSEFEIDKFLPDTTYYFKVYANMLKNGTSVYTRLFDSDCTTCTNDYVSVDYSFKTLNSDNLYFSTINSVGTSEAPYTNLPAADYSSRYLFFTTRLYNITNYTLKYEILEDGEVIHTWNVDELSGTEEIKAINSNIDITDDDFIFGNGYYQLKIYAVTKILNDNDLEENYEYVLYSGDLNTNELVDPTFAVVKNAGYDDDNSKYYLEFKITPIDKNYVIKNGEYYVELRDSNNQLIEAVNDIDATIKNNPIIFNNNLTEDTEYTLVIYADVYKNNVTIRNREVSEEVTSGIYTNSTVKEQYVMYTVGEAKVSLGSLVIEAFEDSVTTSFVGGANIIGSELDSNIKGITEVMYTIKQGSNILVNGCYVIGKNTPIYCANQTESVTRKNFQYSVAEDYYKLVIDPNNLKLKEEVVYTINLSYYSSNTLLRGRSMSYPIIYTKK